MDPFERLRLIKEISEEIITEEELLELLKTKERPVAYDGFEPSGLAHLPFGVMRPILVEKLLLANIHMKLWIADWFAWVNGKYGGNLEVIRRVGEYFIEVWKAAGLDISKVEIRWTSEAVSDVEYWKKVITVAENTTISRAQRALTIMGRTAKELMKTSQLFYPMMQVADIFWLDVDICQLGMDQRRANILAREIAEKLRWKKPVAVHHHMLMGLQGKKQPEGYDENPSLDMEISSKMSKSKPETSIFVHDSEKEIYEKIRDAYCPAKEVEGNPMLDYAKHIIFRKYNSFTVERKEKYGGNIEFWSYDELEKAYKEGKVHPADLKEAVAFYLNMIISPIREHFNKDPRARKLYEEVKSYEVTR
jgi:tyrosyl-tRNA synthetase